MRAPIPLAIAIVLVAGAPRASASELDPLAWLAGCWQADGGEPGSVEQWMPLAGGSLLGMARTVRGGRTVAWEFMRIATTPDGKPAFFAQPSNKPPATFPALRVTANEAVFENPGKDFPQRVVYRLAAPDKLDARIEGQRDGVPRSVAFPMTRVSCDTPARPKP
jgi:hypothetical protein